jgi:hypothetical protein
MKIRPHAGVTRALRVLLKLTIAATALLVPAAFYSFYTYSTLPAGVNPNETLFASDVVAAIVSLVQFLLAIITTITFFCWIYRTNKNLRALSDAWMTFTPGWSVGWFFIPIANFFKPYQVMKELWNASHGKEATDPSLVGWWWALWLLSNFVGRLASRLVTSPNDASGYAASAMTDVISNGFAVVVYVVELMLVTRIAAAYARNIVEPTGPAYGGSAVPAPPPLA